MHICLMFFIPSEVLEHVVMRFFGGFWREEYYAREENCDTECLEESEVAKESRGVPGKK